MGKLAHWTRQSTAWNTSTLTHITFLFYSIVHFTKKVPLPYSMTETVYDVPRRLGGFEEQLNLIDTVFLAADMKRLLPVTALYAPNDQWTNKQIELADISVSVLENHIFEKLLWCHVLVGLAGTEIESHNGQFWFISVNEEGFPCFDIVTAAGESDRSCVTKCDILARNGIVHEVDKIVLFDGLSTRGPSPPVPPTFVPPSIPQSSISRPAASRPSVVANFGPMMPVAFSKPKPRYDLDELDAEGPPSGATAIAFRLSIVTALILCLTML
jgi:hypothetical protein